MKKAQIFLALMAVLIVASAALAFKAKRLPNRFYRQSIAGGLCTFYTYLYSTTTLTGGRLTNLATAPTLSTCPILRVTSDM